MRRVQEYSIVREEDSLTIAIDPETHEVVTREQYDELVWKYNLVLATQHATCEYLKNLHGDDALSLLVELKAYLPSSSRPTIVSTVISTSVNSSYDDND